MTDTTTTEAAALWRCSMAEGGVEALVYELLQTACGYYDSVDDDVAYHTLGIPFDLLRARRTGEQLSGEEMLASMKYVVGELLETEGAIVCKTPEARKLLEIREFDTEAA